MFELVLELELVFEFVFEFAGVAGFAAVAMSLVNDWVA